MIQLQSGSLTAHILPYGATLSGLWHKGRRNSLVLGSPDPAAYTTDLAYCGAVVGPVSNRVTDASVTIDGIRWQMEANEGPNCLHSGGTGLHAQVWQELERSGSHVVLGCNLPHGLGGLPGNRQIEIRYEISDDSTLAITMQATSDQITPLSLAHHPYWNLDTAATIAEHALQVHADKFLPTDAQTLPTGEIRSVVGTAYDLQIPRLIPTQNTLDANLCLWPDPILAPKTAATLTAPSGVTLEIATNEPGLQVYNGVGLTPCSVKLHDGRDLLPCSGVALEPQRWPDAEQNSAFPSVLLHPKQVYLQKTLYRIYA